MKASYQWLRALVPQLTASPSELAARLTAAGLEVEGMHAFGAGVEPVVLARVLGVRQHPTKSGLRLVNVDRGGGASLEVICGAPNVPDPGGIVVLAPLGTHLPAKGMTIEKRAIGGVTSEGMLCSEAELGLSDDAEGIIVLSSGEPGTPFTKHTGFEPDTIFEIGLTPNRPDGLGHIGLAREIAALYGFSWKPPAPGNPPRTLAGSAADYVKVTVEDVDRCPHYGASVVTEVTMGPSPAWLRYRLSSLGVRPISNIVDITNLLLLEYGHPMHAFDLDRVRGGKIIVRRAREGEKLKTLDGVDRTLTHDDLLICDGDGPVALGGVMGGANSEINAGTKRVLFECAYFDARGVRRTSRRHALHTESSHRFERGVDPGDVEACLLRANALAAELAGGKAVTGLSHVVGKSAERARVRLRAARMDALLGVHVPMDAALDVLKRLGCELVSSNGKEAEVLVPTHRPDIGREVDLIEEVARVRGFDQVPTVLPKIRPTRETGEREQLARRARAAGVELGLSEAMTYGFVSPKSLEAIGAPPAAIVLKNPLSELQSVMRTSLLPGLLDALGEARRHGEHDVRLFTVGAVFLPSKTERLPEERLSFAAVLAGDRPTYLGKPLPVDVWDAKGLALGVIERMTRRTARVVPFSPTERPSHLHPRGAAALYVGDDRIGQLGPLHPEVIERLDLRGDAHVVELDLVAIGKLGYAHTKYAAIPRFPAATRDIALVVHDSVPAGEVQRVVREAAGALAEDVQLFDRFVGGNVPPEHASLAFHVVYRAPDRTLTDAEVDAQHANVVKEVGDKFGATLRA
jgi:phenylalanyl-tRNA synthetase beta chain